MAAVAAATMADGHPAIQIATATLAQRQDQRALGVDLGDFFEGVSGHAPLTGSYGFIFFDSHYFTPSKNGNRVVRGQGDNRFFVTAAPHQ